MSSLIVMLIVCAWFALSYKYYGDHIEKKLVQPDDKRPTPANELRDDVDYSPAKPAFLWGHHFSSIAGAGPIVGPILAVSFFGWGPTTLWICIGCVFMGAVHDYMALYLSVRHKGKGISEVAGEVVGKRSRLLFGILLWITLIFIITVFAVSAATALIERPELVIPNLALCVIGVGMGLAVYKFKMNSIVVSAVAVVLAYYSIYSGLQHPIMLPEAWDYNTKLSFYVGILFVYCIIASLVPVWLLLQPRDFISSIQLVVGLTLGIVSMLIVQPVISAPFHGVLNPANAATPMWPILFITVACGAISGFHAIVGSGTTSKQLSKESEAKPVAYGGMIMEGVLAFVVAMMVAAGLKWGYAPEGTSAADAALYFGDTLKKGWIVSFGNGFGNVVGGMGLPGLTAALAGLLGANMVQTFLMTSLDTSTRLGRFIFSETLFPKNKILSGRIAATLITLAPAYYLAANNGWQTIWKMFGASNQLIAAVALIIASAMMVKLKRPSLYTLLPAAFMIATTIGALIYSAFIAPKAYFAAEGGNLELGIISLVLVALSVLVSFDAMVSIKKLKEGKTLETKPAK